MKCINDMWRYSVMSLLVAGVCCHASAQTVVFTAVAGAGKMGIKDQIQVQYTIKDAQDLKSVIPPATEDFALVGGPYQSQSSNTTVIGNKVTVSQSVTLTYVLQARKEGTFILPPAYAKDGAGRTYQSNSLTIQVVPGSVAQQQRQQQRRNDPFGDDDDDVFAMMQRMQQAHQQQMQQLQQRHMQGQPQQGQRQQAQEEPRPVNENEIKKDLFIKVVADKTNVKVGEQVTISYKLYSRLPMQMNISKLPSLNGFWTQDFDIPRQAKPTEEVLDGKKYQVFLLKKSALFPQQTGNLELDPAEAKGVARIVQQVRRRMSDMFADPFGAGTLMMNDPFFNNSFYNALAYKDVAVHLKSTPLKINVTDLPGKNKPESFGGAVGRFSIAGKIDKMEMTTDEVANLTLTINGSGNLKLIETPKLNLPNGISSYDPVVTDTITGRSTIISGDKIIIYTIAAQTPGDYDIPAVAFAYYSPSTGEYVSTQTQPIKLHVKPGKNFAPGKTGGGHIPLKDIHNVNAKPLPAPTTSATPILFTAGYWSAYALPVLALMGVMLWRKRDEELSSDSVLLRSKRANKVALQRLATAKKLLLQENSMPFYEEISKAIWLYLSHKLSIPLASLSHESATAAMEHRKVPHSVQNELRQVVTECETALYASGGSKKMAQTYDAAIKVISDLEEVFKA